MIVNEIINERDVKGFDEFMKDFDGLEYQKSFATNDTVKRPRRSKGLISTYDLLSELGEYGEPVNNIDEFLEEYGSMEVVSDKYDNSYNYNGYLDNYINFGMFNLENDQTLVTLSVCLGLDPRSAYTRSVAVVFESEYDFLETFANDWQLLDFEFTAKGKKYYGSFDAGALSEFGRLTLTDKESNEIVYDGENVLVTDDIDDIQDTVSEILEAEIKFENIVDKVNYFWYSCIQLRRNEEQKNVKKDFKNTLTWSRLSGKIEL